MIVLLYCLNELNPYVAIPLFTYGYSPLSKCILTTIRQHDSTSPLI
jgi:hypothetical protein